MLFCGAYSPIDTLHLLGQLLFEMNVPEIAIRPACNEDVSFIFATWLKNYKNSSYHAKRITNTVFYKEHHQVIEDLLPVCSVMIAHPVDDPNTILGYIVAETGNIVHFTYVKAAFREMGIAKQLLFKVVDSSEPVKFTHWTFVMDALMERYPHLEYNPYLAYKLAE